LTFRLYSIGHVAWPWALTRPSCMYTNTHTLLSHPPHPCRLQIRARCGLLAPSHHHPGIQAIHQGGASPSWPTSLPGTPPFFMDQDCSLRVEQYAFGQRPSESDQRGSTPPAEVAMSLGVSPRSVPVLVHLEARAGTQIQPKLSTSYLPMVMCGSGAGDVEQHHFAVPTASYRGQAGLRSSLQTSLVCEPLNPNPILDPSLHLLLLKAPAALLIIGPD
jgi:hypothetical protein